MNETSVVELPERLDISCVESLHLELEEVLSVGNNIHLDASKVSKLDTAGLQVLKAFYDESQKRQVNLAWISPSATMIEVTSFLDLGSSMGLND